MTGFINLNKSEGASSAKEVSVIKRLTGIPCGHMGTLDPMASGVLPVAIGNAARLFDYFLQKSKTYIATFRFGEEYDTLDTTGELIKSGGRIPSAEEIIGVIPSLVGEVMQIPPKYSAKNVGGKRGYMLARAGVEFELPPKKVVIKSIKLINHTDINSYSFEIECGGGTYIRSIARDMAAKLDTCACMSALVRTASGPFKISGSVSSDRLTKDNISEYIIPCENVIALESIYPTSAQAWKLFNGVAIPCAYKDGTYKIFDVEGKLYGLAEVREGKLKVRTKLC